MTGHALVELGLGMVDSKVPVAETFIQTSLAFEERAFDAELQSTCRPSKWLKQARELTSSGYSRVDQSPRIQ